MQAAGDSAKSFLEKLKYAGVAAAFIDNEAPPDADGVVVRRLERQYAGEPLSVLGLRLSDDGEVLSTEANSPAARANIPLHFIIINVNNQFVGSRADFEEIAMQHITLIIKLQTTSAMCELMARILDEEEKAENEGAKVEIDINELHCTTSRYGFLSAEHPLFLRWNRRMQTQREARQLLRQATRDAEEQLAKEASERIRQAIEAEEAKQQEKEKNNRPVVVVAPNIDSLPKPAEEFLLRQVLDESSFGRSNGVVGSFEEETDEKASPEELLRLVCAQSNEEIGKEVAVPVSDAEVRFFIFPTEEYFLLNGMRVTISIKQRSGPLPKPPPGRPPKGLRAFRLAKTVDKPVDFVKSADSEVKCSFCYIRGHREEDCAEKKEQERKLAFAPKERQICRDYLRGRCTRPDCIMRHVSKSGRSRSPRYRRRDNSRSRRSRDRYRREDSRRRRRVDSRRRGRMRSDSMERRRRR